jgi:hypothetical protein
MGLGESGQSVVRPGKDDPREGIKLAGPPGSAAFVGGGLRYASDSFPFWPPRPVLVFHFATRACAFFPTAHWHRRFGGQGQVRSGQDRQVRSG